MSSSVVKKISQCVHGDVNVCVRLFFCWHKVVVCILATFGLLIVDRIRIAVQQPVKTIDSHYQSVRWCVRFLPSLSLSYCYIILLLWLFWWLLLLLFVCYLFIVVLCCIWWCAVRGARAPFLANLVGFFLAQSNSLTTL